jgi:photosystem II stability/assembly factor-like uncharacterized protein
MGIGTVYFLNAQIGFTGIGSSLAHTTDGGQTWSIMGGSISGGVFPNRITGRGNRIAVAAWDGTFAYQGIFMLSTDAGATWDTIPCNRYNTVLQTAVFPAPDTVFGVTGNASFGAAPEFYRSFDGGTTWDTLHLQFALDSNTTPLDIHFENGTHGTLSLLNGQILETTDAGSTWTEVFHAQTQISAMAFWGGNGWIAGQNGYLASKSGANSLFPTVNQQQALQLWPNPSNGRFQIEWPLGWQSPSLTVYDLQGRQLQQLMPKTNQAIELKGLAPGMYWIQANQGQEKRVSRLIIQ